MLAILRLDWLAVFLIVVLTAVAARTEDLDKYRSMSVYQVITDRFARSDGVNATCDLATRTYCGGDWRGIAEKLDYIKGMGFNTVWISPIVENIEEGYHGYWGKDLRKLNLNFGTATDLIHLANSLHSRDMYLMLDVFVQHVAVPSSLATTSFTPPQGYGVFSDPSAYHPFCWIRDYDNATECETCWLGEGGPVALADLDTEKEDVVRELYDWIRDVVEDYGVDVIRVDTVKHVRKSFWPGFEKASRVLCMGEVLHGDPDFVAPYQSSALRSLLNYPTYYPLVRAFTSPSSNLWELRDMLVRLQQGCEDVSLLGTFLENHDQKRFAYSVKDSSLRKNALTFTFVSDGFPIVYSGIEHGLSSGDDPHNRETIWKYGYDVNRDMYQYLAQLNSARMTATIHSSSFLKAETKPVLVNDHDFVLLRGPMLSFLTNRGSKQQGGAVVTVSVPAFNRGDVLVEVLSSVGAGGPQYVVVGKESRVRVIIRQGLPQVYLPLSLLPDDHPAIRSSQDRERLWALQSSASSSSLTPEPTGNSWVRRIAVGLGLAGLAYYAQNNQHKHGKK